MNFNNKKVNQLLAKGRRTYRRRGKCTDCNGRCCNFMVFGDGITNKLQWPYFKKHGCKNIKDKWHKGEYVLIPSPCHDQDATNNCKSFNTKKMPMACAQFPISPFDSVWRYLKQIGKPCGYHFINHKTGKPWNMRTKRKR